MCVHHIHITLYTSSNLSEKGANNAKRERRAAGNINTPNSDNKNDDSILKSETYFELSGGGGGVECREVGGGTSSAILLLYLNVRLRLLMRLKIIYIHTHAGNT